MKAGLKSENQLNRIDIVVTTPILTSFLQIRTPRYFRIS